MASGIVQYVVVRSDLITSLKWPVGAVIAQACHATTAVMHRHADDADVLTYLSDLDNMHKVVLAAPDLASLTKLRDALHEAGVAHYLWVEQPENIPTCLTTKPAPKAHVQKFFKKLKLFNISS
ncbi:putative peptidyl-tRNA hydrolase PTRHD1 [Pollicipes pollicipes]|uniref:putative peptidyl-tRNA hydrolase PTRHD1 n=1 Tax=Pollicipes pollicipes TaxID=41117 RepID=UPI0018856DAB|nr:putative peptidyl-tRNA hydrolase PTRHD1 [Pollicipes pollicipes]XP_037081907.1 putative peptidyl-tRNA hydrolase PTRHD1 [Pollicipes pollicipes]XP_037081908.1 putative peptidyl-tRNA hydrolase PTRHD1 [Pollicipes pollicipes]